MKKIVLAAIAASIIASPVLAREYISIVGSSTVYPFTTAVAEKFAQQSSFRAPVVESTGTGGGMKLFCKGVGALTADMTNASRAIKKSETELCAKNGVTPIEFQVGYDGITFSHSKNADPIALTKVDILMATAEKVLKNGEWVVNPHKKWSDIRSDLPDTKIDIMIPPTTSGTRDAFVELIMEKACKDLGIDVKKHKAECHNVRTDIHVVQMGENDNLIIEKLLNDKNRFGIFGFSFLDQNTDRVQAASIDGVLPTFDTIADGSYTVSRPLFVYIKKEHLGVVPGMQEYIDLYKRMMIEDGPLTDMGLIPLQ